MIEIRTLGRTSITVDGVELTGEAAWPKSLALIVYMAREPGPDRRDKILGMLWPDRDEKRARHALNQLLYTLRKASPELDLESIEDALDFGREVWLDVEEFERRLEAGDQRGAVELYEGPFLIDLSVEVSDFDHWADRQRTQVARSFRKAALQLAEEAKLAGDYETALRYCRRLLGVDSLDDEVQHLRIECLYLCGERLTALRQFEEYRELLAKELEVKPLDSTLELVERIRSEPPEARELPAPAPAESEEGEAPAEERRDSGGDRRSRRGLAAAAAVVVVVLMILGLIWLWPQVRGVELASDGGRGRGGVVTAADLGKIAVVPFRSEGNLADANGSGTAIAELLAANFDGLGSIRTLDHRSVVGAWNASRIARAGMVAPEELLEFARGLGATAVLEGSVHWIGSDVRLVADLKSVRLGVVVARADIRGPRDDLLDLTDQLTFELVGEMWAAMHVAAPPAAGGAGSLKALKHYLRGEEDYRRGRWIEATIALEQAIAEDSLFVPALRALAEVRLLAGQEAESWAAAGDLFERARKLEAGAGSSARGAEFDDARHRFTMGEATGTIRAFEKLAEDHPDDLFVRHQVADAYFHLGPRVGTPLRSTAVRLEAVVEADSDFTPAIDHLWWTAMWMGDASAGRRWAAAYGRAAPAGTWADMAAVATAIAFGDADERADGVDQLGALSSIDVALIVVAVALPVDADPEKALGVVQRLIAEDQSMAHHAIGSELMALLEFAAGRPAAGQRWLDEAVRFGFGPGEAAARAALMAVYGLGHRLPSAYPAPPRRGPATKERNLWVRDTWLSGAVAVRNGSMADARNAATLLEALPDSTADGVRAHALAAGLRGEIALSRGDMETTLQQLRRAARRFPPAGPLAWWETLPYYRYRLGILEAERGQHEAAVTALRTLEDRSLGDLVFRARAHLALASSLEALGEHVAAARYYGSTESWLSRSEAGAAAQLEAAQAGRRRATAR